MGGNNKYKDFTELEVWQMSHDIRLKVRILVNYLPADERYNVGSQILRSSNSTPSNIAEGHGRFHFQENIQFCRQARGSLEETRSHLLYIRDANLINKTSSVEHLIDLNKQTKIKLNGYIGYLKSCKSNEVGG